MHIVYKCSCMPAEAKVEVRERRDDEDVVAWVRDIAQPALHADHARRSPRCPLTKQKFTNQGRQPKPPEPLLP